MGDAWISVLQAVAVALIVLFGQVAVARLSKSAQSETTGVDSQTRATDAWAKYAEKMESRLEDVEARLRASEAREEDNRRRITALERERQHDQDLIERLVGRLRRAIERLGSDSTDADHEVLDLAQHRLDVERDHPTTPDHLGAL